MSGKMKEGSSKLSSVGMVEDLCSSSSDDDGENENAKKPAALPNSKDTTRNSRTDTPEMVDLSQESGDDEEVVVEVLKAASMPSRKTAPFACVNLSQEEDDGIEVIEKQAAQKKGKKKRKRTETTNQAVEAFNCEICLEENLEEWRGFTLSSCGHRFCLLCLSNLIRHSTSSTSIACPSCSNNLEILDIRSILQMIGYDTASSSRGSKGADGVLSWQSFEERFSMEILEQEIAVGNKGTRRCPTDHCNFTFVFEDNGGACGRQFDCPQCRKSYCLHCGANEDRVVGPAHPQMTCHDRKEQLEREVEERRKLEEWKKENSQADARFKELMEKEQRQGRPRPCPKCKTPITKNGGCNHMYCTRCNQPFNWSTVGKGTRR
jgi:hypothetical protein